jgi:hypothetical protein
VRRRTAPWKKGLCLHRLSLLLLLVPAVGWRCSSRHSDRVQQVYVAFLSVHRYPFIFPHCLLWLVSVIGWQGQGMHRRAHQVLDGMRRRPKYWEQGKRRRGRMRQEECAPYRVCARATMACGAVPWHAATLPRWIDGGRVCCCATLPRRADTDGDKQPTAGWDRGRLLRCRAPARRAGTDGDEQPTTGWEQGRLQRCRLSSSTGRRACSVCIMDTAAQRWGYLLFWFLA